MYTVPLRQWFPELWEWSFMKLGCFVPWHKIKSENLLSLHKWYWIENYFLNRSKIWFSELKALWLNHKIWPNLRFGRCWYASLDKGINHRCMCHDFTEHPASQTKGPKRIHLISVHLKQTPHIHPAGGYIRIVVFGNTSLPCTKAF